MKRVAPALFVLFLASCAYDRAPETASAPTAGSTPAPKKAPRDTGSVSAAPAERQGKARLRPQSPQPAQQAAEHEKWMEDLGYTDNPPTTVADKRPDPVAGGKDAPRKNTESPRSEDAWGGRIYLSNDDSMSLASAQRVLWSVAHGERVAASELRPHELLNYFTFARPTIASGNTFGVGASAVRTEEGLSLALTVTGASPARRPLDLTLLIDRSGSMKEEDRIAYVKRGLTSMVDRLRPGDRVDVVLFDDDVDVVRSGFVIGQGDADDLRLTFDEIRPDGSTNLNAGLKSAYELARTHARNPDARGRDARVLVITDAKLTSGDVNPDRITEIARAFDESGIRLAAVGVGSDFDDDVLQRLTEKGRGGYVYLGSDKVVDRVFGAGFDSLVHIVADDVRFALDLPASLGMKRFYGEEMSTVAADVVPVSFHAGTTQLFLQDLKVAPTGLVKSDPLVLDLSWRDPVTGKDKRQRWESTVGAVLSGDRANVTKARALMAWTDLARVGDHGCHTERREWTSRAKTFGGDVETRYLDGLVAGWCREPETGGMIAEAE